MNYPDQSKNPARIALTRAVNRAIAAGSPVYVNVPAHPRKGANILKRTIEYMCQGPFDSDREDALTILNRAIEECFATERR